MNLNATQSSDLASLKKHGQVGLVSVFGLFGGLLLWASNVDIAGAVIAPGTLVVESYTKSVQHQEGGTVKEILVRNQDQVVAGQVLLRLDDTTARAGLSVVEAQLNEALIKQARLVAEVADSRVLQVPPELEQIVDQPDIAASLAAQRQMLTARIATRDGRIGQIEEQVSQLEQQIRGLSLQQTAIERQLEIVDDEASDMEALLEDHLVENSKVTVLHKEQAAQEGDRGKLIASTAEVRATIAERRLQMSQIKEDFVAESLAELQQTREQIAEARQEKLAAADRFSRTEIRAPQAGTVHESVVHTVGGVVAAGEILMQIVPSDDNLMVSVRVDPMDVDKLSVGQDVTLKLSSFDQRSTPDVSASVSAISPDFTQDPATGQYYYTARIGIDDGEMDKLPDTVKLMPGMPVQSFVKTSNRTVLAYLIHPFVAEMNLALRED